MRVTRNHPPKPAEDANDHGTLHPGDRLPGGNLNGRDFWRNKARVEHETFLDDLAGGKTRGGFTVGMGQSLRLRFAAFVYSGEVDPGREFERSQAMATREGQRPRIRASAGRGMSESGWATASGVTRRWRSAGRRGG